MRTEMYIVYRICPVWDFRSGWRANPSFRIARLGGIRIEDTVVVMEKGCEILTPTSKALRAI